MKLRELLSGVSVLACTADMEMEMCARQFLEVDITMYRIRLMPETHNTIPCRAEIRFPVLQLNTARPTRRLRSLMGYPTLI